MKNLQFIAHFYAYAITPNTRTHLLILTRAQKARTSTNTNDNLIIYIQKYRKEEKKSR